MNSLCMLHCGPECQREQFLALSIFLTQPPKRKNDWIWKGLLRVFVLGIFHDRCKRLRVRIGPPSTFIGTDKMWKSLELEIFWMQTEYATGRDQLEVLIEQEKCSEEAHQCTAHARREFCKVKPVSDQPCEEATGEEIPVGIDVECTARASSVWIA